MYNVWVSWFSPPDPLSVECGVLYYRHILPLYDIVAAQVYMWIEYNHVHV